MSDQEKEHSGLVYGEIKALMGELGKLTKIMIEKTAQADAIIARDRLERELGQVRRGVEGRLAAARSMGARAVGEARENPAAAAATFAACGWLAWMILRLLRK